MKNILKTIGVIVALVVAFQGYFLLSDYQKVNEAKSALSYIDSYYSANHHYPTSDEFYSKYRTGGNFQYFAYGDLPNSYVFDYRTHAERSFAVGVPLQKNLGFYGYEIIPKK